MVSRWGVDGICMVVDRSTASTSPTPSSFVTHCRQNSYRHWRLINGKLLFNEAGFKLCQRLLMAGKSQPPALNSTRWNGRWTQ